MDTPAKMILTVYYRDKRFIGNSSIAFEISDNDSIKDIIKELRRNRLKIVSYSVSHSVKVD